MEKAVLMSMQPNWCALVGSGKKKDEIRKTKPTQETPFKVLIYCTANKQGTKDLLEIHGTDGIIRKANCKVIGEFVCDSITHYDAELWDDETFECIQEIYEPDDFAEYGEYEHKLIADNSDDDWKRNPLVKTSCVSIEELRKYLGQGFHDFYAWHISDLVIYDKPKELTDFIIPSKIGCCNDGKCSGCRWFDSGNGFDVEDDCHAPFCTDEYKPLKRPPQSWCYVEECEHN